jgi:hypothetical protein
MAAPTLPPYQPVDEADAISYTAQILGDAFGHFFHGDWHQALRDAANEWTQTQPATPTA